MSEGPWPIVSLGELIASIEAGASFRCRETPPEADEVGVAKVSAVSWGRYDENESKTCLNASRIDPTLLIQKGDFLISRANTVQLVGACVIAERVTKHVMLSDKTLRIQFTDPSLKPWVLHYLRSREGRNQIEALCTGNQESMRNISQKSIRQIQLPLAPAEERDRVIAYLDQQLSRLQASVEIFGIIQAKLKQARASILKAAVEGRLGESTTNGEFEHRKVGNLFDHKLGKMLDKAKNTGRLTPYLRNANVRWQSFNLADIKTIQIDIDEISDVSTEQGDIIVCEGGEPGRCAVWNRAESMVIQKALHRLRPKEPLNSAFFSYQIESSIKSGRMEDLMTGSTIKHLTGKMLRQAVLAVPALEEQNQIVSEIHRRFSVLDQVEATVTTSLARCGVLRQAILKRAFGG